MTELLVTGQKQLTCNLDTQLTLGLTMEIQIGVNMVGVALLVSNDYEGQKLKPLPFVHKDADNLERVFEQFSYNVCRKRNVTDTDFLECYRDLADHNYPPKCKRILVYFSGHGGSDGVLVMQDGSHTRIEDIINCFKTPKVKQCRTWLKCFSSTLVGDQKKILAIPPQKRIVIIQLG